MKTFIVLGCVLTLFLGCRDNNVIKLDSTYVEALSKNREIRAKNRVNYLELTGLFKLDSTSNSFGAAESNTFILGVENIAQTVGSITLSKEALTFYAEKDVEIKTDQGEKIKSIVLNLDANGNSIMLYHEQIKWRVITRSGALYLRVWNLNNPAIEAFKGYESYDINGDFIFDADFNYYERSRIESVASKLGVDDVTVFIGNIQFSYKDKPYRLEIGEQGFVMVSDLTSGETTYGGGRYMYIELPKSSEKIILDFNYLYNPPCAFSEFTTCLYPPRQNQLAFEIKAGELLKNKR